MVKFNDLSFDLKKKRLACKLPARVGLNSFSMTFTEGYFVIRYSSKYVYFIVMYQNNVLRK